MDRRVTFAAILVATLLAAVGFVALALQPTPEDEAVFAVLLGVPLAIAALAAIAAQRWGWWRRFRSLGLALFFAYAIGAGIILLTVLVTARLMFISPHDATLAVGIVIYATLLTLAFGYFVATGLAEGIASISRAARKVEQGDLDAHADYVGNDEIAQLAQAFNRMTARLRDARDQQARLSQARRELIAWVSHDLRTPLTSVRARAEALADGMVTDPREVQTYLNAMLQDTRALSRLIDDLFELATIDAGGLKLELTEVPLDDLVSDTLESVRILAEQRGVTLSGEVAPDVGTVYASPQHVQRVLNNLLSNALAHTPTGERVEVRVERAEPDTSRISVNDTGQGISPEDLPRVFERFYRGEPSRSRGGNSGMGLGLVIARALVEAQGGHIGIESQLGKGTRVWFTLPKRKAQA